MSQFFVATSILDVSQFVKLLRFMSLCYEILIVVLSLFFSAVTSAFQLFTRKLCLQFSGLRMRNLTWNRFPIKHLLLDSLLTPIVESTYLNHSRVVFNKLWSKSCVFFSNKATVMRKCISQWSKSYGQMCQRAPQQLHCEDKNNSKSNDFRQITMRNILPRESEFPDKKKNL